MRSVSVSDGGSLDRDIISCILFPRLRGEVSGTVKLKAGGEVRARILAIEFVCFFSFFLFFFFFLVPTSFSRSNTHIHTRRDAERLKGEGEQFASLDLWITD